MVAYARLKNGFMADEKYHNLMTWLNYCSFMHLYVAFSLNEKQMGEVVWWKIGIGGGGGYLLPPAHIILKGDQSILICPDPHIQVCPNPHPTMKKTMEVKEEPKGAISAKLSACTIRHDNIHTY